MSYPPITGRSSPSSAINPDDAPRLRASAVLAGRVDPVVVGLTEAEGSGTTTSVSATPAGRPRDNRCGHPATHATTHGGTPANSLVRETKPVDRNGLIHPARVSSATAAPRSQRPHLAPSPSPLSSCLVLVVLHGAMLPSSPGNVADAGSANGVARTSLSCSRAPAARETAADVIALVEHPRDGRHRRGLVKDLALDHRRSPTRWAPSDHSLCMTAGS